ncbi:hypothetical protein HY772_00490 [Candidatus Woesearchaeota archaeon]|nr:hypothetical protein [Candidatus Woesearchaeota archaeon]
MKMYAMLIVYIVILGYPTITANYAYGQNEPDVASYLSEAKLVCKIHEENKLTTSELQALRDRVYIAGQFLMFTLAADPQTGEAFSPVGNAFANLNDALEGDLPIEKAEDELCKALKTYEAMGP